LGKQIRNPFRMIAVIVITIIALTAGTMFLCSASYMTAAAETQIHIKDEKTSAEEEKAAAEIKQAAADVQQRQEARKAYIAAEKRKRLAQEKKRKAARARELAEERSLVSMKIPAVNDYKTWMCYKAVKSKSSWQYALLNSRRAKTDKNGFRKIGGYYCVALGSYYSDRIGTRFRITFANGDKIRAVLGDQKSDKHTDKKHQYSGRGNILEFITGHEGPYNQARINRMFPAQIIKIQKYTDQKNMF